MVILFESYGNFSSGSPTYRALVSKRSRGTITLTEKELSFQSEIDKIFYQIKIRDVKKFYINKRFNLNVIKLIDNYDNQYSFYASIKKKSSYSSSKTFTLELFYHLTRVVLKKDKPIFFEAGGGFWHSSPNLINWKTEMKRGIFILTEDSLSFNPFDQGNFKILKVIEINSVEDIHQNSREFIKITMQDQKSYSLTLLTKKHCFTKIDDIKVKKLSELLNQVKDYKSTEIVKQKKLEKKRVDQIKEMLDVSSRIRLDLMRDALDMDEKNFSIKIFEWAHQFNCIVDGDFLVVNPENVTDFLDNLYLTEGSQDKIQCKFCQKLIDPDSKVCPYCGVEVQ
jgi:hypothetical protein